MMAGLLALLVAGVAILATLMPLFADEPQKEALEDLPDLQERREDLMRALKDVEMDHAMGKITDEDRDRLRGDLEGRAVRVLAAIDERAREKELEPGA